LVIKAKNKYLTYRLCLVLLLFILNAFVLFSKPVVKTVSSSEMIVDCAMRYMDERKLIKLGKALNCSGYTWSVYAHFNIYLSLSSKEQIQLVKCTDIEQLGPGDLVFLKINRKCISHICIYLSDNKFIHSTGKKNKVRINSLPLTYWKGKFVCGGALKKIYPN